MAGFRKAKAEQAALKMGLYGAQGSGKTFTALLMAEGIAKLTGKRVALIDTERGSDFYVQAVPTRKVHPGAFDVDAAYTREISTVLELIQSLNPQTHSVIVIDSITHIWQACINAYTGGMTKADTIPFHAWGKIKKPYKDLMNLLLSSPIHAFICGRQGNEFEKDDETGELNRVGYKMKAEGETPYEPHILLRFEAIRNPKDQTFTITAFAEKDRTGVLAGQTIAWPCYENIVVPLLPLLGDTQAHIASEDESAQHDAEKLAENEASKTNESADLLKKFTAKIALCENLKQLDALGKEITPEIKKRMVASDLADVRQAFLEAQKILGK